MRLDPRYLWALLAVFSRAKRHSLAFVLGLRDRLKTRDLNGALRLAQSPPQSPIAKVIAEALVEYRDGLQAIAQTGPDEVGEFDVVDAVNLDEGHRLPAPEEPLLMQREDIVGAHQG